MLAPATQRAVNDLSNQHSSYGPPNDYQQVGKGHGRRGNGHNEPDAADALILASGAPGDDRRLPHHKSA